MKIFNDILIPMVAVGLVGLSSSFSGVQDVDEKVEIVNQDGEKVELKIGVKGDGDADVRVGSGKIVIIDSDGTKREIDVSGAQNVIVNKSVKSIIKDGEEEKQIQGKAIIIGPDGERQEFDLAGGFDNLSTLGDLPIMGELFAGDGPQTRSFTFGTTTAGKYMIGVNCKPVGDDLRAHLDLADGVGLVVVGMPESDSPAGKADVKQHDILIYADQEKLSKIQDLVAVVQEAGKDERKLTLRLLRRGEEQAVEVEPVERAGFLKNGKNMFFVPGNRLIVEDFGPGFVFENDIELPAEIRKHMEELDLRMAERMKEMEERLQKQFGRTPLDDDDEQ